MKKHKEEPEQHCMRSGETNSKFPVTTACCPGDAQAADNRERQQRRAALHAALLLALLLFNPSELW